MLHLFNTHLKNCCIKYPKKVGDQMHFLEPDDGGAEVLLYYAVYADH